MATSIELGALDKALRTLKLGGMLDTLEARLAQARAGELGHIDFLQVLCEDEISRRESAAIARRQRKARFDEPVTMEGFDFAASPKLPAAQLRDLAALRLFHAGESIILFGPVGVGKSHIAQALGQQVIRHGLDVRFIKTSRALAHLAGGHADHTWPKRLAELTRPAVSQSRCRRVPPRQAHQLQLPRLHGRPQLPAAQTTRQDQHVRTREGRQIAEADDRLTQQSIIRGWG
ncbi:ATP-binding protein [Nonomuraea sp. NPDC059194]|uniref:ATP-binding protein n=1 Tax=Nonomuraea sp. NPDC059194 TaxID=3346764 RepID=UPI00369530A8